MVGGFHVAVIWSSTPIYLKASLRSGGFTDGQFFRAGVVLALFGLAFGLLIKAINS